MFMLALVSMVSSQAQTVELLHPRNANPAQLSANPAANPALGAARGNNAVSFRQTWFDLSGLDDTWNVIGDFDGDGRYRGEDGLYEGGVVTALPRMSRSTIDIVIAPKDYLAFVKNARVRRWLDNRLAFHVTVDAAGGPRAASTPGWVPKYAAVDGTYFPSIEAGASIAIGPRVGFLGVGLLIGEVGADAEVQAIARTDVVGFSPDDEASTLDVTASGEIRELLPGIRFRPGVRVGAMIDLGPLMDRENRDAPRYGLRLGYTWQMASKLAIGATLRGAVTIETEFDGETVADGTVLSGELLRIEPRPTVLSPETMNFGVEGYYKGLTFGGWGKWVKWEELPAPTGISFAVSGEGDQLNYNLSLGEPYGPSGFRNSWAAGGHVAYAYRFTKVRGRLDQVVLTPELGVSWVDDFIPDQADISNLLNGKRTSGHLCALLGLRGILGTSSGLDIDACVQGTGMQRKEVTKAAPTRFDDEGVSIEAPGTPFPDRVLRSGGSYWTVSMGLRWTFGRAGGRLAKAPQTP